MIKFIFFAIEILMSYVAVWLKKSHLSQAKNTPENQDMISSFGFRGLSPHVSNWQLWGWLGQTPAPLLPPPWLQKLRRREQRVSVGVTSVEEAHHHYEIIVRNSYQFTTNHHQL